MAISKQRCISKIALAIILCILMSAFVSCGGLPATRDTEEITSALNIKTEWEDSTELPTITAPGNVTLPDRETEEPDDPDNEPERTVRYVASSESDKYHRLSCHYVDRIKSYNKVYYYTESEAKSDGKSPCSVCSP